MIASGGDIIKLKDQIHTKWFELQRSKRGNHDYAFLSKPIYDEIVRLGHAALETLKSIEPESPHIKRIQTPLHEVQLKSWVAEDIGYIGPTPYYVMTPEKGQDVITQDINRLANAVHHAGMSLIKSRDKYCGCDISSLVEDIGSINTGVLKYCEGALQREYTRAWIQDPGDSVEHRPGSATNHANVIRFVPTEKGHNVEMEYMESGDSNWEMRQDGVIAYVEAIGGECERHIAASKCHIPDLSDEEILKLALMISQLKDIDLLHSDCIPLAFSLIEAQANELKQVEPKEIWREPWSRVSDMSEIMDCTGRVYNQEKESEEDIERREELKARRLRSDIDSLDRQMEWAIRKSKEDNCTRWPYNRLSGNDYAQTIRDSCKRLQKETTEPFGWCAALADQRERDIKEAAKDLVDRCPPEGIILGCEAGNMPYSIENIKAICKLAENLDCLDIIRQVEAREKAGVKVEKLKLR